MNDLASMLLNIINTTSSNSSDYKISKFLLMNLKKINIITTTLLSKECNCSKSTITRFCERLGLQDFYELKTYYYIASNSSTDKYNELTTNFFKDIHDITDSIERNISIKDIEQLCILINRAKNVYLLGNMQSNHAALSLQHDLYAFNKIVDSKILISDQIECIDSATEEDLIIIISNTGKYIERTKIDVDKTKANVYLLSTSCNYQNNNINIINLELTKNYLTHSLGLKILTSYIMKTYYEMFKND